MDESARRLLRNDALDHATSLATTVEDRWGPVPDEGSFIVSPLSHHDTAFPESLRTFHDEYYAYAASSVTRDAAGKVLAVKSVYREHWETPGGSAEPGESPVETARREVREETGITPAITDALYRLTMELDFGYDETLPIPVFVFVGEPGDGEVVDADAVETPHEVSEIRWFEPSELPESFHYRDLVLKHLQ
jgi:8-oxo-dGTP pyrophosphatase MutT (NUDIX family)